MYDIATLKNDFAIKLSIKRLELGRKPVMCACVCVCSGGGLCGCACKLVVFWRGPDEEAMLATS